MDGEFYTEDQLQNLEMQQASDQLDSVMEKFLTVVDKFIDSHKNNIELVQNKLNSIMYELQRNQSESNI